MAAAYTLFDTALGRCGIAWVNDAVAAFALPEADDAATAARLLRTCPAAALAPAPPALEQAIEAVQQLLSGNSPNLGFIAVDLDARSDFDRRVYRALRMVPRGSTITYGALAEQVGSPGAARAVGVAMARNPVPVIIPCHRVLAGGGRTGGFSAPGGVTTKLKLLQIEQAGGGGLLFDELPLAVKATTRQPARPERARKA